jgi:hypothetical protein
MGHMREEPVHITLAVEKDADTNAIQLHVVLRHDADNIELTKATTTWYPTREELQFLNEAFTLFTPRAPATTKSSKPKTAEEHHLSGEKDPSIRESVTDEEIHSAVVSKKNNALEEDQVLVQVDEKIIDEAIQRRRTTESSAKNTDTLVDRLTSKKKKSS